jgi:Plasmid pRiA4b ORF-3-like protein
MAKKKAAKKVTKSDFLRKAFGKDPLLDHRTINARWAKAGHEGEISPALFYQVRNKMGIKIEWSRGPAEDVPAPGSSARRSSAGTGAAYQLKVTLADIRPPIWRRLLVPDRSLEELHEILQVAMGWQNCHLFAFEVGDVSYTDPIGAAELDMVEAGRALLSDVIPGEKFRFRYNYDFGDDWRHEILVEKVLPPDGQGRGAVCLDGKRACPPEDVGGPWGYSDFLEAIADPENDRHEELLEWSGPFDPEEFDLDAVNAGLRQSR